MVIVGRIFVYVGCGLFILSFLTRRKMIKEGTWKTQGGVGAYLWFVISVVFIVVGLIIG